MAGDPRQAAPTAALLPRVGRLLADNQRLIAFLVLAQALRVLAFLPLLLSLGGVDTFSDYARAEANGAGLTRVLEDGTAVGAGSLLAFGVGVVGAEVVSAWALAAFLRSFDRPTLVTRPEPRLVLRLFALYLAVSTIGLLTAAVAAPVYPLVLLGLAVPTLYADLAIAFDDRDLRGGVGSSLRFWRRFPGRSALVVVGGLAAVLLTGEIFSTVMDDAETVFPPVFLAMILANGLVTYALNCVLIALFADRETPDGFLGGT